MYIRKFLKSIFTDVNKIALRDKMISEAKKAEQENRKQDALDLYRKAIGIDPTFKPVRFEIGKLAGEVRDDEKKQDSNKTPK